MDDGLHVCSVHCPVCLSQSCLMPPMMVCRDRGVCNPMQATPFLLLWICNIVRLLVSSSCLAHGLKHTDLLGKWQCIGFPLPNSLSKMLHRAVYSKFCTKFLQTFAFLFQPTQQFVLKTIFINMSLGQIYYHGQFSSVKHSSFHFLFCLMLWWNIKANQVICSSYDSVSFLFISWVTTDPRQLVVRSL